MSIVNVCGRLRRFTGKHKWSTRCGYVIVFLSVLLNQGVFSSPSCCGYSVLFLSVSALCIGVFIIEDTVVKHICLGGLLFIVLRSMFC
jgi:hypothetical protein